MPSTGLKTKTKRVSARSPFENTAAATHSADEDIDMDDETSSDEESVPEKDEDELKLEKMLFGDDDGFMGALKAQQQRENGMRLAVLSDESADEEGEDEEVDLTNMADEDLFFLDSGNVQTSTDLDEMAETPSDEEADEEDDDDVVPAVWHDSDDERIAVSLASQSKLRKLRNFESEDIISGTEYTRRLRRQFQRMNPLPEWADPELAAKRRRVDSDDSDMERDEEMDSDEDESLAAQPLAKLLQNTSDLTRIEDNKPGSKRRLRQEVVNIQRLKDVGKAQPSSIDSLMFHPHYPLLLSSGPASTLFLHHISPSAPSPNPLLTSLHIKRTPLHTSAFAPSGGNRIFASGRRRYFHIWDLDTGKVDKVNGSADRKAEQKSMERFKISLRTLRRLVRVDGRGGVADFAWWSDGEGMTVASKNGEVSEWDGRQRRIIARWLDAGAVGNTVIALGGRSGRTELGGDRWVAIGSTSGIVNIYDRRDWAAAASSAQGDDSTQAGVPRSPTPIRVFDQLTTPVSHLVFAPDGQMMVMASRWKKDALRLVHLPSCTVYRNWPTSSTPLGRISSVAISPNNEQLAVANEQGRIRLFEIRG
ncbi:hypothetical protein N7539_008055 [Penicillium diatomitis]|uniref:Uncharacterized protein n=1 Tax=Penicillium diatomitis TaxID=2819901 RepID=A0A9X0BMX3_9EURO|nr:uncharacterized protein N7539_008055 [Penicillium diatomitis]KAJ5474989.1 hypothetical protein N7539_008055 [Penicillium diatomitis]